MPDEPSEATVLVAFHPAPRADFVAWVEEVRTAVAEVRGFLHLAAAEHLQQAVSLSFTDEEALQTWLDSPGWSALLASGVRRGIRREFSDLVTVDGEEPPMGVGVFVHRVEPANLAGFTEAQRKLMNLSAVAPGFEYSVLIGPRLAEPGIEEWTAVVKFRNDSLLAGWRESPARAEVLGELRSNLEQEFSESFETNSFGSIVRVTDGKSASTPEWKVGMMVLLVLYPTVMILSRFIGPSFDEWGAEPWLSMWMSQILSVSLLTYLLMPAATWVFAFWLDPERGSSVKVSIAGAVVVAALYAATLAIFASVRWLQFWDYV
ncbi:antibiotic biosynthesis monooxygenase [Williamsia soli]|uniref:antibiotic biosynthesis monooxygenase n=1 Tax=Williamsia soli TaxID=364929 RepID=UPI001A9EA1AE|nr:antibiotic biosynthesis monooxygenase [Williamsia soli]